MYETIGRPELEERPELGRVKDVYMERRSSWPLRGDCLRILTSKKVVDLVKALLGSSEVYLFNEQYIVKPSRSGAASSFLWHRDGDWLCTDEVGIDAADVCYLSVWVALDDVTRDNGCLQVITPNSECLCVNVNGIFIEIEKGSAVVMSHTLLHCSGPNKTKFQRRAWMPQFSCAPILKKNSDTPVSMAIPLGTISH